MHKQFALCRFSYINHLLHNVVSELVLHHRVEGAVGPTSVSKPLILTNTLVSTVHKHPACERGVGRKCESIRCLISNIDGQKLTTKPLGFESMLWQLCDDTSDTFWSDPIVCSDSSITSIIAALTLTLGVNGPLLLVERSACNAFCIHPKRSVNFIRRKWIRYAIYVLNCELQLTVNDNSLLPWFTILTADSLLSTATLFGKTLNSVNVALEVKTNKTTGQIYVVRRSSST